MNRKLRKLIKTPRLYFKDLIKKRLAKGVISTKHLPWVEKLSGSHKFSVVCAVYGVESYIEQFIASIENQTLDFVGHIELIMVDDGSLDSSASIIKKWVDKYPNNIKYVSKENGGQASARNLGLTHVSNEWVTFIDPDDFVDSNYFAEVDKFLTKEKDVDLVSCNLIFYMEGKDQFIDSHPMMFRFRNEETLLNIKNMKNHIQLNVSSAFFRLNIIVDQSLKMSTRIKPAFEDAHFVNKYLLQLEEHRNVGFIKNAKYYYRKRADNSSTLDSAWKNPLQFSDKLELGSLDLLKYSLKIKGHVPVYIQRAVLYDFIWYVRYIVNHKEHLSYLAKEQQQNFLQLSKEIFSFIDEDTINRFNIAGCWFFQKVGMLGLFKGMSPSFQIIYVEDYDPVKKLVLLKYYYHGATPLELVSLGGEEITPVFAKSRVYDFLTEVFVNERRIWIPLKKRGELLEISIGNMDTRLYFEGTHHKSGVMAEQIIDRAAKNILNDKAFPSAVKLLRKQAKMPINSDRYNKAWLLMDRDTQADDNAEHLYHFIVKNHPDINAFFVLSKASHDWQRLEKSGFRLIDFGSLEYKKALLNADHVISSHADHYVVSLLEKKWYSDLLTFKFTFLQHGVIHNDLSNWLNNRSIDVFVTTTVQEFDSIAGDLNRYKFSTKEVALTGLPRHDTLLKLNSEIKTEKLIVIMPTWRLGIVGETVGRGSSRDINDDFFTSDYALTWKSFLHSTELKEQAQSSGFRIEFFPHSNVQPYLDWFETPDYIKVISHESVRSMQDLFCRASLMITDYSSVAFDMAYLDKSILYYQFDYDDVFGGGHSTSEGYFNFERDAFGSICRTENEMLFELASILARDGALDKIYSDRVNTTFIRRDGQSCQRVYEAIKKLEIYDEVNQKEQIALEYAQKATDEKSWELASRRWESIYSQLETNTSELFEVGLNLARTSRHEGKSDSAKRWLECLENKYSKNLDDKHILAIQLEWAKLLMNDHEWQAALVKLESIAPDLQGEDRFHAVIYQLECLANLNRKIDLDSGIHTLNNYELSGYEVCLVNGWGLAGKERWSGALKEWTKGLDTWAENLFLLRAVLLANIVLERPSEVFETLTVIKKIKSISKPVLLDPSTMFSQVLHIGLVEEWGVTFEEMSAIDMALFIKAHRVNRRLQEARELLKIALRYYPEHGKIIIENAEMYSLEGDFDSSLKQWKLLLGEGKSSSSDNDYFSYRLARAYAKKGLFDKAYDVLSDESGSIIIKPKSTLEWELLASLAEHSNNEITLKELSNAGSI